MDGPPIDVKAALVMTIEGKWSVDHSAARRYMSCHVSVSTTATGVLATYRFDLRTFRG